MTAVHRCPDCRCCRQGGEMSEGVEPTPPPCLTCGCPWNSCLIHAEFCCDACAHFPAEEPA